MPIFLHSHVRPFDERAPTFGSQENLRRASASLDQFFRVMI